MDIAEIKLLVMDAFNGVRLGDGHSLRDVEEMDNWGERGSDKDLLAFPDVEIRDDWAALSVKTLDRYAGLAHVDAAGFRYYIPAFMLSVLADYQPSEMRFICTLSALYPRRDGLAEYTISRYTLLNKQQRSAIACYLQALPSLVPLDGGDEKCVERAIRNYWHEFLPSSETSQIGTPLQDQPQHYTRYPFVISTDRARLDMTETLRLLHTTHWGKDMAPHVLERAVANSVCFGVYENSRQVGFGRVISDLATYAYLTDFVIEESTGDKA